MPITNYINEYLKSHKLSMADLARMSGLPYSTIVGIFKKNEEKVKLTTIRKLSRAMHCTMDELVGLPPPGDNSAGSDVDMVADGGSTYEHSTVKDYLSAHEREHLSHYRRLVEDDRRKVDDFTDALLLTHEQKKKTACCEQTAM